MPLSALTVEVSELHDINRHARDADERVLSSPDDPYEEVSEGPAQQRRCLMSGAFPS
jgi:hypothetical protein